MILSLRLEFGTCDVRPHMARPSPPFRHGRPSGHDSLQIRPAVAVDGTTVFPRPAGNSTMIPPRFLLSYRCGNVCRPVPTARQKMARPAKDILQPSAGTPQSD